ncbi:Deazaflavin-dependent oxidoreductase, nitroreductase family OS=Tsukamurella paurometabola (strain ATCC 8368 / DSM / CCUG 35730 / CIP 100753 / JCM 10117/ KCTC 9821 / NBRC 16120 / NCIMB 702349 / NCTC 13040) OX=521096 GN=Tpau_0765 PE=4 SV=1 [Tsukamurella paurometabola]|uniref:Deazaflavin-dependent oxidoreductase, nitroreductase family n=1 Tax=Tsukamurella paurometabola (strain ATCC 8368 / DSM 20162 / CCUG 35730 / CIP 100753 / JCM 10117 / KCTC 9821 / NBRC 16120 / NCIMB 702349 / NCTC 13040) TaxID=521096 RepID=D5UTP8_TSUPD|nr:hypothetical protein [Tsukamurella paurometabola]ADG77402.1 conserved hypothetical protein [Tsukamurella paurometabola DSM 20162]SUP26898.1 Uncharacterised protein [Tsukamurella paurometabola]
MNLFQRTAKVFNAAFTPLLSLPVIGPALGKSMVTVSYTGRKSGKQFSLPIAYQRTGDEVVIGVAMPDQKQWWRNFLGEGGDLTLHFPDGDRTGHAVAVRSDDGSVGLKVALR